ncbi:MAG: A/G-specific adenine glycosylase [Parcubacteria group bacterium Gr01-1014_38]|nr:MAG: A/G-specific adenine glycosylase [Parcubacteria group bacterium Gr01-1014_38]
MPLSLKDVSQVQRALVRWFRQYQRDLPWRRTKDPYRILVSEIMLQQTQVDRVIPKYRAFLRRFPIVQALARATPRDILLAWAGMGYNRRALYLRRAAQEIVAQYGGTVPTDPALLQTLPGVGAYTAAAVATFATGIPRALADTNVRRVIGRIFLGAPHGKWRESRLRQMVERATPRQPVSGVHPSLWGHALMDFGALVCKATPRCAVCPVRQWCKAYPQIQRDNAQKRLRRANRGSRGFLRFASTMSGRGEHGRGNRSGSHPRIPDRIYRGRILQALRERDPAPVSLLELAVLLCEVSRPRLHRLVRGLAAEGLLTLSSGQHAQLPRGETVQGSARREGA